VQSSAKPPSPKSTLTAENARLRAELAAFDAGWKAEADHRNAGWKEAEKLEADLARVSEHAKTWEGLYVSAVVDLARVTTERDALLAAARGMLDMVLGWEGASCLVPWEVARIEALRAAVAACAPPASGEEG
jgi:hypothetical protein